MKAGWRTERLGDLVVDGQPGFAEGRESPDGVFQFRMNNITKDGRADLSKRRRIPGDAHKRIDKFFVAPGDILFNATNSLDGVGKSILIGELDEPAVFSNHFLRLRVEERQLDPRFLARWLHWNFQRGVFQSMARQWVNQATVSRDRLFALTITLPPLDEQRRIAAVFDQVDVLRNQRRQTMSLIARAPQELFYSTFGDPQIWDARWPMGRIGDMVQSTQYGSSSKAGDTGTWPILRMGNITDDGRIDLSDLKYIDLSHAEVEKYSVQRGDLLFNRTNSKEKVGKAAVVHTDEPLVIAGYLVRVRLHPEHSPDFVSAYLGSPHGLAVRQRMAKAAVNQANINPKEMQKIRIAIPPKVLQERYAQQVAKVDELRESAERHLISLDALFASLQSRAFAGELDVSKVALPA